MTSKNWGSYCLLSFWSWATMVLDPTYM